MSDSFDPSTGPVTNGQPTLRDRVRELQLGNQLGGAKSRQAALWWLPWLLCVILALAWAGVGYRWYRAGGPSIAGSQPGGGPAPAANSLSQPVGGGERIEASKGTLLLERKGYIIPAHQISISPIDVAGRITELNLVEGKQFKKGDVLAVIDGTGYEAEKIETEAQLEAAKARLAETESAREFEKRQAEAELAESKAQMEEAKFLYDIALKTSLDASSREDRGQREKKLRAAEARVRVFDEKLNQVNGEPRQRRIDALKREVEAATARLTRAKWKYDNCEIKAPVTGIILTKKAEIGSLINPGGAGGSVDRGTLCEMADLSDLEIELEVEERDVWKVKLGLECVIKPDAYPDRLYEGYVHRILPIANRGKGILPVRIKIKLKESEIQGYYLKPEMNALVSMYQNASKHYREEPSPEKPREPQKNPAP